MNYKETQQIIPIIEFIGVVENQQDARALTFPAFKIRLHVLKTWTSSVR